MLKSTLINVLKRHFVNTSLNPWISDQDPHQIYETGKRWSYHDVNVRSNKLPLLLTYYLSITFQLVLY